MYTKSISLAFSAAISVAAADSYKLLYQGNGSTTWLENLRVRSNGNVLTTVIGPPANLLSFDPTQEDPEPVLISTFPSILGLSGITEISHDVFIITGANTTGSNIEDPPKNATKVWKVDFNKGGPTTPQIDLIGEPVLPLVTDFNGLTTFNESIILASATFQDTVVAMDVNTGDYWTAFEDSDMSSINGIRVGSDGYLYWTATSGAVRALLNDDLTLGDAEILYSGSYDDLAVSYDGFELAGGNGTKYLYMADNSDLIQQLILDEATVNVTSAITVATDNNATSWGKPTSCDFGRTQEQKNKVYCTTGGSLDTGSSLGGQLFEITLY